MDLRYVGQFNEVEVPFDLGKGLTVKGLNAVVSRFHERHDGLYGYSMQGMPVELINLRVTAKGLTPKPTFARSPKAKGTAAQALIGRRPAYFNGKFVKTPVYDGLKLQNGHQVRGPAIVQQPTTTIIVPPDFDLKCDEYNNYLMYPKGQNLATLVKRLSRRS
jgi:N-methylhydantoinase A